jgi:erythromycin esterase
MAKFRLLNLVLLGVVLSTAALAQPAADAPAVKLETGKSIARDIKPGESHSYAIFLETGQFLDAAVNQQGIDVMVRILAPDDGKLMEIDTPNGIQGDEPIALEAKTTGSYHIEVTPLIEGNTAAGRYEIRINCFYHEWSAA